jgi:transmembrane sensor
MDKERQDKIDLFTENYQVPFRRSKSEAWQLLESKLDSIEEVKVEEVKGKVVWLNWVIGSLAVAAVVSVLVLTNVLRPEANTISPVVCSNVSNETTQVKSVFLPDSSSVKLNSNSSIKYSYNNKSGERNVALTGDAMFSVKKGKQFEVDFDGGTVKVLGTTFYVSAYSEDRVQVDCVEGVVEVTLDGQVFKLTKGKGVKVFEGKVTGPYDCNTVEVKERIEGIFIWNKVDVAELIDFIGNRFGYKIVYNTKDLNRNFSGKVDLNNLEEGLLVISTAMGIDYSIDENHKAIYINAN